MPKPEQLRFYFGSPQPLAAHELEWCKKHLAPKLEIIPATYHRLYPESAEAEITVNFPALLTHPRRDDILRHAADRWYPKNDGGVVHQVNENTFYVCTFFDDGGES